MENHSKLLIVFTFFILFISFTSCEKEVSKDIEIRGIYGSPKPFWDAGYKLNELGINAVFVRSSSLSAELIFRSRFEGQKIFVEFPALNGKGYVEKNPNAWAINKDGNRVEAAAWFMGVCPSDPGFQQYRFQQLKDLLIEYDVDGVWLDYVHFHAQFEDSNPILPETCFCENCLNEFASHSNIKIPPGSTSDKAHWILENEERNWRDWRCRIILGWTQEIKEIIHFVRPGALLGLYHCPWNDDDFEGARRNILGLDYDLLKNVVDVFSPMVYHDKMGKEASWVKENMIWFSEKIGAQENTYPKIWPIVQAHDDPDKISKEEFESVLVGGTAGGANGVMMFTASSVVSDGEKLEVMKKVYRRWEGK